MHRIRTRAWRAARSDALLLCCSAARGIIELRGDTAARLIYERCDYPRLPLEIHNSRRVEVKSHVMGF
jgi:hypothetical protein